MIEVEGNLWDYNPPGKPFPDARVITTNGYVKRTSAVMGKGCALEAARRFPQLPKQLGLKLHHHGNRVFVFPADSLDVDFDLVTFPVKHDFREKASRDLIYDSCFELLDIADEKEWQIIIMPRPGTGAGGLNWIFDVEPLLASVLDDRFYVIDFGKL